MNIITQNPPADEMLGHILELESVVMASLPRPDILRRNTLDMWRRCLSAPHSLFAEWDGSLLIAIAVLYIPMHGESDHLAALLTDESLRSLPSANYKICLVHPAYRGHGLQRTLGQRLDQTARQQGIGILCSTVSPHNPASIRSLEHLGYRLDQTLEKYGSPRHLYYRQLM